MPPGHHPSNCIICLIALEGVNKNGEKKNSFEFIDRSFPTLTKSFHNLNMILPKCNVKARTKIQFCVDCQEMLNEIDDIYGEIDLLQNKIQRLKSVLQSKVYTSRIVCKEKQRDKKMGRNDEFTEMIRDLVTGIVISLPRLTTEIMSERINEGTESPTSQQSPVLMENNPEVVLYSENLSNLVDPEFVPPLQAKNDPVSHCDFDIVTCELEKLCSTETNISESCNNNDQLPNNNIVVDEILPVLIDQNVHMEEPLWNSHDQPMDNSDDVDRDLDYMLMPDSVESPKKVRKSRPRRRKSLADLTSHEDDNSRVELDQDYISISHQKNKKINSEKSEKRKSRKSVEDDGKAPRDKLKVDITPDGKILYKGFEILQSAEGFRCSICLDKKLFKLRISAVLHIMKNHMDCKKQQCDLCGKQFLHLSNLKNHQKVHSTEKSLMCDICGRVFKLRETLLGHRKTHDAVSKPFSCEHCGKQFLHQRDCVVHTRTHTKEKPYQCHVCPKSFIVLTLLNRHLQSHVRDDNLM